MKRALTLIVGLILLAALLYHCIKTRPPVIEADVLACVSEKMAGNEEFADVEVTVDGRDVSLSGPVASQEARAAAEAAAGEGCGARVVNNSVEIRDLPPYETIMCIDEAGAHVHGDVESEAVREEVVAASERRFPGQPDNQLAVRKDAPAGHSEILPVAIRELTQLESGCITMRGSTLTVKGEVRSEEARERLVGMLDRSAGDQFTTAYELTVPELSEHARTCQAFFNELLEPGEQVLFDFDSAEIHAEGRALLDSLVDRAIECSELRITVTGHSDSVGEAAYNRDLSLRRAEAVVDYLVSQGVDGTHLSAKGYGETQPRASNDTEEGRARNRRIEFRVREVN
jgi:OOP family OmpA-OmpF porin